MGGGVCHNHEEHIITWCHGITENLVHGLDILFLWRVQYNDDGADEAQCTPNLAHSSQLLMKEKGREDGTIVYRFPVVVDVVFRCRFVG